MLIRVETMKTRHSKRPLKVFKAYRLAPDLADWLKSASARRGKTETRLIEEAIRAKMILKGDA